MNDGISRVGARTMAEIARLAGVAESTVSRALAGSTRVSQDTRQRIAELVKEHGYRINTSARNLRMQRSRTVEVVIAISEATKQHFSDPFFSQIIASLGDALAENGYDMLLSRQPPWSDVAGADALTSNRADGVIVIGQGRDPAPLDRYAREHKNVVVWGADIAGRSYPVVGSDNFEGGQLVGRHLMSLGRRRVVFLGDVGHTEIGLRHRGLVTALTSVGQASTQTLTLSMPFDGASAYDATHELFRDRAWHDAVFAASDILAIAAIQALADLNIRVPGDVAVVGYDDIAVSALVSPALTTVRQDTAAGGRALVGKLLALMDGDAPSDLILPTQLIVRRSCGAT
jgi:DNA-binding LacI/PurR family transcriptional regulator